MAGRSGCSLQHDRCDEVGDDDQDADHRPDTEDVAFGAGALQDHSLAICSVMVSDLSAQKPFVHRIQARVECGRCHADGGLRRLVLALVRLVDGVLATVRLGTLVEQVRLCADDVLDVLAQADGRLPLRRCLLVQSSTYLYLDRGRPERRLRNGAGATPPLCS